MAEAGSEGGKKQSGSLLIEVAPALVFFATNYLYDLQIATAAVMVATVICLAVGYHRSRKIPMIAAMTALVVIGLGGLSLYLEDETFIKMKPTVAKLALAGALAVGLLFKPSLLERALGSQIEMPQQGWVKLTWAWVLLGVVMAGANEVAWRSLSTDDWVAFKTGMVFASILAYGAATLVVVQKYLSEEKDQSSEER